MVTTTDILMFIIIIILVKIIIMIEGLGKEQYKVTGELIKQNERTTETNRISATTSEHIHKMLIIKEYENNNFGIKGERGLPGFPGPKGDKGDSVEIPPVSTELEMTLSEVCAVILETLVTCPDELKDTPETLDTESALTNNNNILTTYAEELFDRVTDRGELVTDEAIREAVISDLNILNGK